MVRGGMRLCEAREDDMGTTTPALSPAFGGSEEDRAIRQDH